MQRSGYFAIGVCVWSLVAGGAGLAARAVADTLTTRDDQTLENLHVDSIVPMGEIWGFYLRNIEGQQVEGLSRPMPSDQTLRVEFRTLWDRHERPDGRPATLVMRDGRRFENVWIETFAEEDGHPTLRVRPAGTLPGNETYPVPLAFLRHVEVTPMNLEGARLETVPGLEAIEPPAAPTPTPAPTRTRPTEFSEADLLLYEDPTLGAPPAPPPPPRDGMETGWTPEEMLLHPFPPAAEETDFDEMFLASFPEFAMDDDPDATPETTESLSDAPPPPDEPAPFAPASLRSGVVAFGHTLGTVPWFLAMIVGVLGGGAFLTWNAKKTQPPLGGGRLWGGGVLMAVAPPAAFFAAMLGAGHLLAAPSPTVAATALGVAIGLWGGIAAAIARKVLQTPKEKTFAPIAVFAALHVAGYLLAAALAA